ncbi:TIGR01244 family sulfur transferase [Rhodanobacter spathiphylli]|uniref:Beta-lactamase hydrolase-like protein n=1 Tax=Rhodanobacter spathiphylli B39 TaxID=1163407 RepID=I4VY61_9GAMM|nr:TIGR01244 family sulfur transferase [Rhodanobacter spathiphylli]EIL92152.1 beta-lactamase hydrolase-like protein [Rhodanobacter spathiphylli B39]
MQPRQLTEQLSVAPQIAAADMPAIVAQGFRSIVNNRPDGEEPGQPDNAALEAAAHAAGLEWRHIPVVSGKVNDDQVRSFSEAMAQLPGPVLAFCRSGTRCSALWALSSDDTVDNILATTEAAGYDLSILRGWLEMSRR